MYKWYFLSIVWIYEVFIFLCVDMNGLDILIFNMNGLIFSCVDMNGF